MDHSIEQLPLGNESAQPLAPPSAPDAPKRRGASFWLIFLALCVSLFQVAFELVGVGIALPTIAQALHATDFVWVGSAYALAATCSLPIIGGFAQAFGRRPVMLASITIFAIGSAICGAAPNMQALIAGRVVQGFGGGGLQSVPTIILSDLVSLRERGTFNGFLVLTWSAALCIAPISVGTLAEHGQWRWFFYLNVPLSGLTFALVFAFLRLKAPSGSMREKLGRIDWIGNALLISSSTSVCIALTWAGIQFPWTSVKVLAPLILGLVGMFVFFLYDALIAESPVVPFSLLSDRTSASGYATNFVTAFLVLAIAYYFPAFLQACRGASPIRAGGVDWLGFSVVLGPTGIVAGVVVAKINRYRPVVWTGFVVMCTGIGCWALINENSGMGVIVPLEIVTAMGAGILYTTGYFPVLAPQPISHNAKALSLVAFVRSFAQIWGITIGGAILQNQLIQRLPEAFVSQFPGGVQLSFAAIPLINGLPPDVKDNVRKAFADSLRVVWYVLLGVSLVGAAISLLMREVPMHTYTDEDFGLKERDLAAQASEDIALKNVSSKV
ncbi:MFS general substrate transporter [Exidia glandulosa HHB12029]|uniref:MFS general substrate transporter n=1 Tax=Exidia glandulosa HHB12029 TaxID=1314781 RepID=A0A165PL83_EXIGL|nr:MFS general substrate transporter [Exidia glandulosa HHB12029]